MRYARGVVVVLVLATVFGATVVASTPSTRLCGICDVDGPRHPSADGELSVLEDATYGESSVTVELHENGSSVWTERVTFDRESADRLATNRTLRETFVEQTRGKYVINDPSTIETRVDNRTLVARYRVANSAQSGIGGVLLFDLFHDRASYYRVDTDRVVIHGPPGTTVVNDPPTGTVQNGSVVYTDYGDSPTRETYIAFATEDSIVTDYAAGLTMALHLWRTTLGQVALYTGVLGLLWGAFAIGITSSISAGSSGNTRSDGSDGDSGEETPGDPLGLGRLLSAGIGLLLAIPIVVALRIDYGLTFWLALPAAVVLWGSLWTVYTTRQRVVSVLGVALSPTFLLLPMTSISGFGGSLLLGFGFLISLVWALAVVAFHVIGRYLRNHPAIK